MALTVAVPDHMGNALRYKDGLGASDNDVIVQTEDVSAYNDFRLMYTSTGSLDVYPSLDGTNYATAPLTLYDLGSTAVAPATVVATTGVGRIYGFSGTYAKLRVLQNGAGIPATVCLMCSRRGSL
jgi:hypothetical protein